MNKISYNEGSLTLAPDSSITRLSEGLAAMLGFDESELKGRPFTALSPYGFEKLHEAIIESAKASRQSIGRQTSLLNKAGEALRVYLSAYPLRDHNGELYAVVATVSLDERHKAHALLSYEFQRLFSFSNDAVIITDKRGSILNVNRAFLDVYGYERDEVIGKNPRILKSAHSTPGLYERMWAEILDPSKGYWRGEIINLRKDGTEVPALLTISAVKDESGEIRNFLGIALDMTRQKELDRLNKLYIDYLVHDMRGPLTLIMSTAELLLMGAGASLNEKEASRLKSIITGADRLGMMVSDLLDFSKAREQKLSLSLSEVDVDRVIREAASPFAAVTRRFFVDDVPFGSWRPESKRVITADEEKLRRVIYNLLSNAFKHSKEEVRIETGLRSGRFGVTVKNDGRLISQEDSSRMFEAFYQSPDGVRAGGAGLGLSIVKCFVELHGGRVSATSQSGYTAFSFVLPCSPSVRLS